MRIGLTPLHTMSQTRGIDGQWEGNRRKGEESTDVPHLLIHIIPSHKHHNALKYFEKSDSFGFCCPIHSPGSVAIKQKENVLTYCQLELFLPA